MPGILPDDVGAAACTERLARAQSVDLLAGTELGELIADRATAAKANTVAAEREKREAVLAEVVDHVLQHELAKEYECTWPGADKIKEYTAAAKTFIAWARDRGWATFPLEPARLPHI
jgi:hypothetical protein